MIAHGREWTIIASGNYVGKKASDYHGLLRAVGDYIELKMKLLYTNKQMQIASPRVRFADDRAFFESFLVENPPPEDIPYVPEEDLVDGVPMWCDYTKKPKRIVQVTLKDMHASTAFNYETVTSGEGQWTYAPENPVVFTTHQNAGTYTFRNQWNEWARYNGTLVDNDDTGEGGEW